MFGLRQDEWGKTYCRETERERERIKGERDKKHRTSKDDVWLTDVLVWGMEGEGEMGGVGWVRYRGEIEKTEIPERFALPSG